MASLRLRRRRRLCEVGAGIVVLAVALTGCPAPNSQAKQTAPAPPPPDQQTLNRQAAESFVQADTALNVRYKKLLAALPEPRRAKLQAAQRAWIVFRDAEADFVGSEMAGGSAEPLLNEGEKARLTRERSDRLQRILATLTISPKP